ncbi:hypothetical protein [Spiroplasma sp. BIUS-1]|uniref:hypothetical protein n=1 Tax=Spiroplasma sp. BIUS-1 TaxID=216964 RepID=UPI0013991043|nr:hypothetical protein [Spiroplasma sp. BIUS-1]QHX36932.1 hypothetical protein SBIUS_v1c06790 [Spiroplasma sp. BIUS-1]
MKKLLGVLSATTLAIGTITPIVNFALYAPTQTITKQFSYKYNFNQFSLSDDDFKPVNGVLKAVYTSDDFTKSLTDCIQKMFDSIPEEQSNVYNIKKITTSFVNSTSYANNDVTSFNEAFKDANKDIKKMNIKNHRLEIEKYSDPASGPLYYVNVWVSIGGKEVRLFGGSSYKKFNSLKDIQKEFTNTFDLEIVMEVIIEGYDKTDWGIELPQNIDFQTKTQIINWFMMVDQTEMRNKIIDHINKEKKTKITKMDWPRNLYKAVLGPDGKYIVGDPIGDGFTLGKEYPYFYIGITSKDEANGEFKILVKNTPGPKEPIPEPED